MNVSQRANGQPHWPLVAIAVMQAVALYVPPILSPSVFAGDAQQQVWWTYRFADPALFPNDPIAALFSQPALAPLGLQALYRTFVPWIDAQVLSELLPFLLAIATGVLAWLVGRRAAGGDREGGTVAAIFAALVLFRYLPGGTANTFAQPLLLLGLWALMADRPGWLGTSVLSAALFYPPIGLVIGLTAATVISWRAIRRRQWPAGWFWFATPAVLATAIIVGVYATGPAAGFGPAITAAEARSMTEFGPNGRVPFYTGDAIGMYIEGTRAGLGLNRYAFAGLVALFAVGLWRFRRGVPAEAWPLAASSVGLFAAAHFTLFALHMPNRYLVHSFPVLIMMCLAAWLPRLRLSRQAEGARPGVLRLARSTAPWMAVAVLVASVSVLRLSTSSRTDPALESAYAFLRAMPKGTLIAAHPEDANPVPLRTQRSVLASREVALPFHTGYYRPLAERTHAILRALYASDWTTVDALHERYGATVFLVNRRRYRAGSGTDLDEPFRHVAVELFARTRGLGFVLDRPPAGRVLFERGDYLVVQLGARLDGEGR